MQRIGNYAKMLDKDSKMHNPLQCRTRTASRQASPPHRLRADCPALSEETKVERLLLVRIVLFAFLQASWLDPLRRLVLRLQG